MGKCFFIRTSPALVFHAHTCLLIACLHAHHCTCIITLAYFDTCVLCTWMLSLFHLHWGTCSVHVVVQVWWKCQCVSVSVEVSVFKGFSGRTLRNAFGKKRKTKEREKNKHIQNHVEVFEFLLLLLILLLRLRKKRVNTCPGPDSSSWSQTASASQRSKTTRQKTIKRKKI